MKVILTIKNIASGPYFLVSGRTRPDKYRFARVPTKRHLHQLVVDMKEAPKVMEDLALRTQQSDIPVSISFEVEDSDLDKDGALSAKDAIVASRDTEIAQLRQLVRNADAALNERQTKAHGRRITDTELDMLKERDEMLELLKPHARLDETPLGVILRLTQPNFVVTYTTGSVAAPPPMAEAEPETEPAPRQAKKKAKKTG